jgi:hypothetical protein
VEVEVNGFPSVQIQIQSLFQFSANSMLQYKTYHYAVLGRYFRKEIKQKDITLKVYGLCSNFNLWHNVGNVGTSLVT